MTSILSMHPSHYRSRSIPYGQESLAGFPSITASPIKDKMTTGAPRGSVTATLNFYKPPNDGSAPYNWVEEPPQGDVPRNFGDTEGKVQIADLRGRETDFSVDGNAFAAVKSPDNSKIDWKDDESIKKLYYPEVEQVLLKHTPGANRVLIFDHTSRRAEPNAHRGPVNRAHIDQTAKSAKQRVEFHLPDEAKQLLQGRYRIINVWRPLNGEVQSHPLAFADSATVAHSDMVPVEHRYPDRVGETAAIRYSASQKWYYWSGMENDERLLLQCFDSAAVNNRLPHSAFVDPRSTEASKPRESIEVRALVFG